MPVAVMVEYGDRLIFGRGQYEKVARRIAIHTYNRCAGELIVTRPKIAVNVLVQRAVLAAEEVLRRIVWIIKNRRKFLIVRIFNNFNALTGYLRAVLIDRQKFAVGGCQCVEIVLGHTSRRCAVIIGWLWKIERRLLPRLGILQIGRVDIDGKALAAHYGIRHAARQSDAGNSLAKITVSKKFGFIDVKKLHHVADCRQNNISVATHIDDAAIHRNCRQKIENPSALADVDAAVAISQRPKLAANISRRSRQRCRQKPGSPCEGVNLAVAINSERTMRTAAKNSAAIPVPRLHVAERRPQSPLRRGGEGCQKKEG